MYSKFEKLLKERKITTNAVAKATNVPVSCLYDWKSGRCKPNVEKLYKIAKFFGVPMEYFIEE